MKLIRPTQKLFYAPTGEKITRRVEGYEQEVRSKIEEALSTGSFEALGSLKAQSSSTPLVTVTYTTPREIYASDRYYTMFPTNMSLWLNP